MQHILVVEDDPTIREMVSHALQDEGYQVDAARDGAEALALARAHRPRAILLDLMMPVMDGWAFLTERQRDEHLAEVPVVVLSAAREGGLQRAKDLGAAAFLAKPFDLDALLTLVERLAR